MKACYSALLVGALLACNGIARAQTFNSGSNGSYGPIAITTGTVTIDLPIDGIIHATTVSMTGGTLRFNRNTANTPVYLLATGNVDIRSSAYVIVSGQVGSGGVGGLGGPGGFSGGNAGNSNLLPSDGKGPGGGKAASVAAGCGHGSFGAKYNTNSNNGPTYGRPVLVPLVGGSGGGGQMDSVNEGGGGGGAILIASNSKISVGGTIAAEGGNDGNGCVGSGGAVRLVAPKVEGAGALSIGTGRARIDTLDRTALNLIYYGSGVATIGLYMHSFLANPPTLTFTNVAGTAITGTNPVTVVLPSGAPTSQTVTIRAANFTGEVPIRIALYPDNGNAIVVDDLINMAGQPAMSKVISVNVPPGVPLTVHAWTR